MKEGRLRVLLLCALLFLAGGCVAAPPEEPWPEEGERRGPLRLLEFPTPGAVDGGLLTPALWRFPRLLSRTPSPDEGSEVGVSLICAPVQPTANDWLWAPRTPPLPTEEPSRFRLRGEWLPAAAWFQARPSADLLSLYESLRLGRLLSSGPRPDGWGRLTGLATSDDGPAFVAGYRVDF